MPEPRFDLIRDRLASTREQRGLTLRQAAQQVGVSPTTLSRIERGIGKPDLETLDSLIVWLDLDRAAVFRAKERDTNDTPGAVRVLLRADRNLDSRTAGALAAIFESVYKELTEK